MRIKIVGEVTAERLVEAFNLALEKTASIPGSTFYGANLYINLYNSEGVQVDLANDVTITLTNKQAEKVNAPKPYGNQNSGHSALEQACNFRLEESEEQKQKIEEWRKQMQERREKEEESRRHCLWLDNFTTEQMAVQPDNFVKSLNEIVSSVWDEFKPVDQTGKTKGMPRPMPAYEIKSRGLVITCSSWKSPRKIKNPILYCSANGLETFWKHPAWIEARNRIIYSFQALLDPDPQVNSP